MQKLVFIGRGGPYDALGIGQFSEGDTFTAKNQKQEDFALESGYFAVDDGSFTKPAPLEDPVPNVEPVTPPEKPVKKK